MKSKIILETGESIEGFRLSKSLGCKIGRIIFDTRVVGYEKVLTCPEYSDKIVCLSYPLIGNYGINYEDTETRNVFPAGLIISELSLMYSNYRAHTSFEDFLANTKICAVSGIDTQYITGKARDSGNLWGAVVPGDVDIKKTLYEIKVKKESGQEEFPHCYVPEERKGIQVAGRPEIAVLNLGLKNSEISFLESSGYGLKIVDMDEEEMYSKIASSDALYISSGPESYSLVVRICGLLRKCVGKLPVLGAGLGHLVLGILLGGEVSGSFVNHYGVNHPVVDIKTKKCIIAEQMHSFILKRETLSNEIIRYVHLNDETVEGLFDEKLKAMSVSFIPQKEQFETFFSLIKG